MSQFLQLYGLDNQGSYIFTYGDQTYPCTAEYCITRNRERFSDFMLLNCIGQQFIYQENFLFLSSENENQLAFYNHQKQKPSERVPISNTILNGIPCFESYLVSNSSFNSSPLAFTLALCEAALRSNYPSELTSKLPILQSPVSSHKKNNFKFIFELFNRPQPLKSTVLYIQYFDFNKPETLQSFCDYFSVGLYFYFQNPEKNIVREFRVPETPQILPIPIIRILKYENLYFVLYTDTENANDGYSGKGVIEYSYQSGEYSFYAPSTASPEQDITDRIIALLTLSITKPGSTELKNNYEKLKAFLNSKKVDELDEKTQRITNMLESLKVVEKALETNSIGKPQISNVSFKSDNPPNSIPKTQNQFSNMSSPPTFDKAPPLIQQGQFTSYYTPVNQVSTLNRENTATTYSNSGQAPVVTNNQTEPKVFPAYLQNNFSKPEQGVGRASPVVALPIFSQSPVVTNTQIEPKVFPAHLQANFSKLEPGIGNSYSNQAVTDNARLANRTLNTQKCNGCSKKEILQVLHDSCKFCIGCIAYSVSEKRCVGCNSQPIKIFSQLRNQGFNCNGCKTNTKDYKVNTDCGCIICKNCINLQKFKEHSKHR